MSKLTRRVSVSSRVLMSGDDVGSCTKRSTWSEIYRRKLGQLIFQLMQIYPIFFHGYRYNNHLLVWRPTIVNKMANLCFAITFTVEEEMLYLDFYETRNSIRAIKVIKLCFIFQFFSNVLNDDQTSHHKEHDVKFAIINGRMVQIYYTVEIKIFDSKNDWIERLRLLRFLGTCFCAIFKGLWFNSSRNCLDNAAPTETVNVVRSYDLKKKTFIALKLFARAVSYFCSSRCDKFCSKLNESTLSKYISMNAATVLWQFETVMDSWDNSLNAWFDAESLPPSQITQVSVSNPCLEICNANFVDVFLEISFSTFLTPNSSPFSLFCWPLLLLSGLMGKKCWRNWMEFSECDYR